MSSSTSSQPLPSSFEAEHVHVVYDHIAKDFSRTRHTRWPFVSHFLESLPAGSVVLDAGCGNGKYLGCGSVLPCEQPGREGGAWPKAAPAAAASSSTSSKGKGKVTSAPAPPSTATPVDADAQLPATRILPLGFDMSLGLLGIASSKGHETIRGDCFDMSCFRRGVFDHAISIATIHHFATAERRMETIKQIILAVIPPRPSSTPSPSSPPPTTARILLVVWALEQDPSLAGSGSARKRLGGKKGAVPISHAEQTDAEAAQEQDVFIPWELQGPKQAKAPKLSSLSKAERAALLEREQEVVPVVEKPTFNRYYHLFRQWELSGLVRSAARSLGARFECPYELGEDLNGVEGLSLGDGLVVELVEERWERENWVGEVVVRWAVE